MAASDYPIGNNIIQYVDYCVKSNKTDNDAYSFSTQTNCQMSRVNGTVRLYCPPDCQPSANGGSNNMWGGLCIGCSSKTTPSPQSFNYHLQQSHTYIIMIDVKGYSDRTFQYYYTNHLGWSGGGLNPAPSNAQVCNPVTAGFNSSTWKTFWYKYTINDGIYKTCTSAYWDYVQGNTYLSYRHFGYGPLAYSYTGTNGTEVFMKNFRMYDITDNPNFSIARTHISSDNYFMENENAGNIDPASDFKYGEFRANNIYEN